MCAAELPLIEVGYGDRDYREESANADAHTNGDIARSGVAPVAVDPGDIVVPNGGGGVGLSIAQHEVVVAGLGDVAFLLSAVS